MMAWSHHYRVGCPPKDTVGFPSARYTACGQRKATSQADPSARRTQDSPRKNPCSISQTKFWGLGLIAFNTSPGLLYYKNNENGLPHLLSRISKYEEPQVNLPEGPAPMPGPAPGLRQLSGHGKKRSRASGACPAQLNLQRSRTSRWPTTQ